MTTRTINPVWVVLFLAVWAIVLVHCAGKTLRAIRAEADRICQSI